MSQKHKKKSTWVDPDDAPDLSTPEWEPIVRAAIKARGRPKLEAPKIETTIRLDPDIVAHFKAEGQGWQTRINDTLRNALKLPAR